MKLQYTSSTIHTVGSEKENLFFKIEMNKKISVDKLTTQSEKYIDHVSVIRGDSIHLAVLEATI